MEIGMITTVDDYIKSFPSEVQIQLEEIRLVILKTAPDAEECISYKMPTYKKGEFLVHFAGYKSHIGFYPTPSGIKKFTKEIMDFKNSKGAIQFPLGEKLPKALITKIVKFRVKEVELKFKGTLLKDESNFLQKLGAPAERALKSAGITTLKKLSKHSKKEILKLHGVGKSAIPKLEKALMEKKLFFKDEF